MLAKVLLLLVILVKSVYLIEESDLDPSCQIIHTINYGYRQFYSLPQSSIINGSVLFNFSLAAPSNGHVLLSEKANTYPGYEIVIGAGGNEFSEIRKYSSNKFNSKTSAVTKNIISPTEFTKFSISIKDLVVSVSYMNNSKWITFMEWSDISPLHIKFLSFSSWSGVMCQFMFDCKGAKPVPEIATPLQKLKKNLLKFYDSYTAPATDIDKLLIDAAVNLQYLSLDAKKSLMTTQGQFYFKWFDPKMQWEPEDYDNITSLNLLNRQIWIPDFVLYNGEDEGTSVMENSVIRVFYNGTISWSPKGKFITWCTLDLRKWPFDKHTCNISLGLYSHPEYVQISLSSKNFQPDLLMKDLEWEIISLIGETTMIVNPSELNSSSINPSSLTMEIGLKRKSHMHIYAFIFPILVCVMIILSSFWLPLYIPTRFYLHITCFFLLMFNIIALDRSLPALPSATPYLLTVNCNLFFLTVIHTICSAYFMSKVETREIPASKLIDRIVTHPIIHSILFLDLDSNYYGMKEGNEGDNNDHNPKMNQWTKLGIIFDRILFLFSVIYISVIFFFSY